MGRGRAGVQPPPVPRLGHRVREKSRNAPDLPGPRGKWPARTSPGKPRQRPPPGPPSCAHRGPRVGDVSLQPGTRGAGLAPDRRGGGTSPPERKRDQVGQEGAGPAQADVGLRPGRWRCAHVGPGGGSGPGHCAGRAAGTARSCPGTGLCGPGWRTRPFPAPPASVGAAPATEPSLQSPSPPPPRGPGRAPLPEPLFPAPRPSRSFRGLQSAPSRLAWGSWRKEQTETTGARRDARPAGLPRDREDETHSPGAGRRRACPGVWTCCLRDISSPERSKLPRSPGLKKKGKDFWGQELAPSRPAPLPHHRAPKSRRRWPQGDSTRRVRGRGALLRQAALLRARLSSAGFGFPRRRPGRGAQAVGSGIQSCGEEPGPFSHHDHAALRGVGTCTGDPQDPATKAARKGLFRQHPAPNHLVSASCPTQSEPRTLRELAALGLALLRN
ncbi:uncharacterized protein ACIGJ3_005470 [Trichechus inunguis]